VFASRLVARKVSGAMADHVRRRILERIGD